MSLTQGLHRALREDPDRLMTVSGDRRRTVHESVERVARLAGGLRDLGVQEGDRVGILSLNSDRYHELLLAVWWAGAVVNPVNIRWNTREIAYALAESQTDVLFVDDMFAPMATALREQVAGLRTVVHCGDLPTPGGLLSFERLLGEAQPVEDARSGGAALAGLFYTGGTTGLPKGVMLSHGGMLTSALGAQVTCRTQPPRGTTLVAAPMFHLAAIASWLTQVVIGGTLVFVPVFEPAAVMRAVETYRPQSMLLVPAMIQAIVDHPDVERYDLSSLTCLAYGASPISEALLSRAMTVLPNAGFMQGYGMTELSPIATLLTPQDHLDGRLRSAGRAAAHAEVRIVDPDDREVPPGTVGEVVVRGGHLMLGYWNRPEETATALRGGWMHTGDAGYLDKQGYLSIVDRIKDMIVTGGENVYSAEVENAIARHPAVASCAVIGVPDPRWGERVHAVVVLMPGAEATADEIREHVKGLIAGYKAPRSVEFVDTLPMSAAGKILKRELRRPHWTNVARAVG